MTTIEARLVDALYVEAMLLADEARSYFEGRARVDRDALDPWMRVGFSCESLKVTTRLMHVIAWLLARRAVAAGEMEAERLRDFGLGDAAPGDANLVVHLPAEARALIAASGRLHARLQRLEEADEPRANPARALMERLERAF